jgi:hypothetical protein
MTVKFCPACGDELTGSASDQIAHAASHPATSVADLKPALCDQCGKYIENQPYAHRCNAVIDAIVNAPLPYTPPYI